MARPIPLDPPVTIAVLPSNSDIYHSPLLELDLFTPHNQSLYSFFVNLIAYARPPRRRNRAAWTYRNWRINDVLIPIAFRRRNIARQRKAVQSRHCDIVSPADTGFEHSSAPDRDAFGQRKLLN